MLEIQKYETTCYPCQTLFKIREVNETSFSDWMKEYTRRDVQTMIKRFEKALKE